MKLVTIRADLLSLYEKDKEVLQKSGRPYVVVLRLKYKERNYDFAVSIQYPGGGTERAIPCAAASSNDTSAQPARITLHQNVPHYEGISGALSHGWQRVCDVDSTDPRLKYKTDRVGVSTIPR